MTSTAASAPGADGCRIIVLTGPSGAGKSRLASRLARRHGWPIVRLDDFYRCGGDPDLPMLAMGVPDWDDPRSWHRGAAVRALLGLCADGRVDVPVYDIGSSSVVGHQQLRAERGRCILVEGIFAAELIGDLRARGALAAAYCVRNNPWLTFWRRLARDLREHRKPPLVLWRRGLTLWRQEPLIVARHARLGATPMTAREAERASAALAGPGTGAAVG